MYNPPFEIGMHYMDVRHLLNADHLSTMLERHRDVLHIAGSHVHRESETWVNEIGASIALNAAHYVTLNLELKGGGTYLIEPPTI